MTLNGLSISYPDFKLNDVIDPEQFDINNREIVLRINEIKDVVNKITDSVVGDGSGADQISLTAIAPFTSTKLQAFLGEVLNRLKSTTAGTSGSEFIGSPAIAGVTGATVYSQLGSLKALLDSIQGQVTTDVNALAAHKGSVDHDGRYYTEAETDAKLAVKADANTLYTRAQLDGGQLDGRYYTEAELVNGAMDTRYYTESEVNSIVDANKNGDHVGTWRGMVPSQVSEAINGARLDVIEGIQPKPAPSALNLPNGIQVINMPRTAPYNVLNIRGRTLINLFGRDGGCEDVSVQGLNGYEGTTKVSDTTRFTSGTKSTKVTIDYNAAYFRPSRPTRSGGFYPTGNKCYILLADVYNESTTGAFWGYDGPSGTFTSFNHAEFASVVQGSWRTVAMKLSLVGAASDVYFEPYLRFNGVAGNAANVDSVRCYEISQAKYDSINFSQATVDSLAKEFPYVDDMKPITNPYAIAYGENLLPPFTEWALHTNTVVAGYQLALNATADFQSSSVIVTATEGQTYTLSFISLSRAFLYFLDESNTELSSNLVSGTSITVTAPSRTKKIKVLIENSSGVTGWVNFTFPMLNLGTTAKPFTPRKDQMLAIPTQLASNMDAAVSDQLYRRGSEYWVERHFKTMDLTGDLAWEYYAPGTGFKLVLVVHGRPTPFLTGQHTLIKYDGKLCPYDSFMGFPDSFRFQGTDSYVLAMVISNSDSGWGETYQPTADEIKAYFYGWRMYKAGTTLETPYDGTAGAKAWFTPSNMSQPTVTDVPTRMALNYTPYKLQYQLATPTAEQITPEGEITLSEGLNQVETGVGMIVREKVNPQYYGADRNYYLNSPILNNKLRYQPKRYVGVYKNNNSDTWTPIIDQDGNLEAFKRDVDVASSYQVTYLVRDRHNLSCNFDSIQGEYDTHVKSDVDRLMRNYADVAGRVSVVEAQKAERAQPQWVVPTLLNGWINLGSGFSAAGYRKETSGIVRLTGLIKDGVYASGTVIFTLPLGYRPRERILQDVMAKSGSTLVPCTVEIHTDGRVMCSENVGSSWLSLEDITFPSV